MFTFESEIAAMYYYTDLFHKAITLTNSGSWRTLYFSPGTAEFSEVQKIEDAGSLFTQTLRFVFPGEDDSNSSSFDFFLRRPLVTLIQYSSGVIKIIGSQERPGFMLKSQKTDSKTNGCEFTITCTDIEQACWKLIDTGIHEE
jgi:hypothetical protein